MPATGRLRSADEIESSGGHSVRIAVFICLGNFVIGPTVRHHVGERNARYSCRDKGSFRRGRFGGHFKAVRAVVAQGHQGKLAVALADDGKRVPRIHFSSGMTVRVTVMSVSGVQWKV